MANEELGQRGYIQKGELKGDGFGAYEQFNIGATSVTELVKAGLPVLIPSKVPFKFIEYKATKNTKNAKVDRLYVDRRSGTLKPRIQRREEENTRLRTSALRCICLWCRMGMCYRWLNLYLH
jgi:hypothetical protein